MARCFFLPDPFCQAPRGSEVFVHRSGRTARAGREGPGDVSHRIFWRSVRLGTLANVARFGARAFGRATLIGSQGQSIAFVAPGDVEHWRRARLHSFGRAAGLEVMDAVSTPPESRAIACCKQTVTVAGSQRRFQEGAMKWSCALCRSTRLSASRRSMKLSTCHTVELSRKAHRVGLAMFDSSRRTPKQWRSLQRRSRLPKRHAACPVAVFAAASAKESAASRQKQRPQTEWQASVQLAASARQHVWQQSWRRRPVGCGCQNRFGIHSCMRWRKMVSPGQAYLSISRCPTESSYRHELMPPTGWQRPLSSREVHQTSKQSSEQNWLKRAAREARGNSLEPCQLISLPKPPKGKHVSHLRARGPRSSRLCHLPGFHFEPRFFSHPFCHIPPPACAERCWLSLASPRQS